MKPIELKFVLKLLGHEGYRASISKLNPSDKTSASDRDRICRDLADRGIVAYSYEIQQFKIELAGLALLKQNEAQHLLSKQHISVLTACAEKSITPGQLGTKVPTAERQSIIQDLTAKGLIKSTKNPLIKTVWLTEQGKEYLKEDFIPDEGRQPTISLTLLRNYLNFLRKEFRTNSTRLTDSTLPSQSINEKILDKPSDTEVLTTIKDLDRKLGANNYLPIFHLRKKLQPPLSRDELDQILYRLQKENKLEMSFLIEGMNYSDEQIQAGITQDSSSTLFFLEVIE